MGVFYPKDSPPPPGLQVAKTNSSTIAKESIRWPAFRVSEKLRNGQLSVTAYTRALLDRRDSQNVKAWISYPDDKLLATASSLDTHKKPISRYPLWGCPIAVKDIFATREYGTQYGCSLYEEEWQSDEYTAAVVAILNDHHLVVAGKTVTTEFAWTMHGKHTANPHHFGYSPGGSSSGSAAAVANFEVPLAIGSQTFGSIIRPASYCGIYGYKPTHGLIPTYGMRGFAPTVDTIGFFSRSVEDMQALATIFDISDAQVPTFVGLKGAKIAWCKTPSWKKASAAAKNALTKATAMLRRHNVIVEELVLPSNFDGANQSHRIIATKELSRNIQDELNPEFDDKLDRMLLDFIAEGKEYTTAQYRNAMEYYSALRTQFDSLAQPYEAVITLSATGEPPKGLAWTGDSSMNCMWTALHVPCISIPGFGGENGLPIGIQLVQARWRDQQLLSVAKEVGRIFEAEGDWKSKL